MQCPGFPWLIPSTLLNTVINKYQKNNNKKPNNRFLDNMYAKGKRDKNK